jgi:hypothetical protein
MRFRSGLSILVIAITAMVVFAGCRQPKRVVLTKEQKERITSNVLKEAPAIAKPLGVDFADTIRLLGVEMKPATAKPGDKVEITYYWESLKATKGDWKLFIHLEKPRRKRQILDHNAVGELYPIAKWKKGEIIRDVQRITLDGDFPPGSAELWIGVFDEAAWKNRQQNERMSITKKGAAKTDKENRALGATLSVKKGAKTAAKTKPAPAVEVKASVKKLAAAPTIDGTIAPEEWAGATKLALNYRPDARPYQAAAKTELQIAWDAANLYLAFQTKDKEIVSQYTKRDDTLWKEDVVEIYLDPDGDQKDYLELQVAPTGAVFDAFFSSHRKPDWPEASKNFNIEMKTAVTMVGTPNDKNEGGEDASWNVEVAIPFASIPSLKGKLPAPGDKWKANFYRLDVNPKAGRPSQAVWSPAGGDFHNLSRAGTLTFAE